MSFGEGFKSQDELRKAMEASAKKERRVAFVRDGRRSPTPAVHVDLRTKKGLETRTKILGCLSFDPKQAWEIAPYVGVGETQVKSLLREMMQEGKVHRDYVAKGHTRIAVWSLPEG